MKKSLLISLLISFFYFSTAEAQVTRILNRAADKIADEILYGSDKEEEQPEPSCACSDAEPVMDLGGDLDVDYTELGISSQDDGSLLVKNQASSEYYIVKNGKTEGPYNEDDPKIKAYGVTEEVDDPMENLLNRHKDYISRSGDKYLITFMGTKYGPYAQINDFIVTKSKDKFAAMVVQDVMMTEDQGKKMEEAMENAKTEQERMALAMQMNQQMMAKMMAGGGTMDVTPKFVSNIDGATYDLMSSFGGSLNGTVKYDDILVVAPDKIMDLKGNTIHTLAGESCDTKSMFVSTDNKRFACFSFGTLTFSDKTTMNELFNPYLVKTTGKVYLAYMYYSPKTNSIMQCKISF